MPHSLASRQHVASYYAASAHASPDRPALQDKASADACVIGGGNAYLKGLLPELEGKSIFCGTQVVATVPLTALGAEYYRMRDQLGW